MRSRSLRMMMMDHIILLGAGASQPAGVPTAIPMVDRMAQTLNDRNAPGEVQEAYSYVVSTLRQRRIQSQAGVDIETVYQAVDVIATRQSDVRAAFVLQWNHEIGKLESRDRVFEALADMMRQALVDLTYIEDANLVRYYEPLVMAANLTNTPIFTLNYDNAVELAADQLKIDVDFGLTEWEAKGAVSFDGSGLVLAKLHGSVTWASVPDEHWGPQFYFDYKSPSPLREELRTGECLPYVVFGTHNKLTAEAFMLSYLAEFTSRLRPDTILHVVGYGFGDAHINHIIARWRKQGGMAHVYDFKDEATFRQDLVWKPGATSIASHSNDIPDLDVYASTSASLALSSLIPQALARM